MQAFPHLQKMFEVSTLAQLCHDADSVLILRNSALGWQPQHCTVRQLVSPKQFTTILLDAAVHAEHAVRSPPWNIDQGN